MTDRLSVFAGNLPRGIDAVLITSDFNRRYFLRFSSSSGTLVVTRDKSYFIIDGRYFEATREAVKAVKNCEVVLQQKTYDQILRLLQKHGAKTLGLEEDHTSMGDFARLCERLSGIEVLPDGGGIGKIIACQRTVKDKSEIERIQKSQDITDETFTHLLNYIKPGFTEREIAFEIQRFMWSLGSQRPAFEPIVAAGANSSKPHAVPTENKIKDGDFIVLDFGAVFMDYCSDMTRTVGVGNISAKQREAYGVVLEAQISALEIIKPGEACMHVDKIARDLIDKSGYKGLFAHGLGHSLGLEVHEPPSFSAGSEASLKPGVVMSVEPGIYIPGEFGVRIEDLIAVTETGHLNFTRSTKELIMI